jgi:hypothetical protein
MSRSPSPLRIAMWSGPRNISTAMMRSWGNRSDTVVVDEPFYAFYLKSTGKDHPGAWEIVTHCETDVSKIIHGLTDPIPQSRPGGKARIFYQKQMTHHLLPEVDRQWLGLVTNCFLIRHPAEVIPSYIKKNADPDVEDLGFRQQAEIFDLIYSKDGVAPPVIDARDVLQDPERTLRLLCRAIGVEFEEEMLFWPAGPRETDGIWAKHWYDEVYKSTSFQPYQPKDVVVPEGSRKVYERCLEYYDRLHAFRLH